MSEAREDNERGKKRKKKRSRVQMAKKFARQRNSGSEVDSDTYRYMVRILELIGSDFPSSEEKQIFVNNVYEETVGREIEYARNRVGSRVLDSLMEYSTLETIQRLVDAFGGSLRPLSSDRFASHVLQRITTVCADRGTGSSVADEAQRTAYNDIVLKLSKYFTNNMEEFIFDPYANHLLRASIECLGGLIEKLADDALKGRGRLAFGERRIVSVEYKDLLLRICERLLRWPQFLEFGRDELTSGLLQSVLYSLKDINEETTRAFIRKITRECFKGENQGLSSIFENECSVRLLEACLAVADTATFREIHETLFAGNLGRLSTTQTTNFSVQRLLDRCASKEDFDKIFQEMVPQFSKILEKNFGGVVASMANACLRLQTNQGAFVGLLSKTLGCETPERQTRLAMCISALKSPERLEEEGNASLFINLHGSLTLQATLNFNKPIKLINSILGTSSEELVRLFSDPKGSRVLDAYMDSKYVGEKSREKLAKKLQGYWAQLARTTHGSRSLERMWRWVRANNHRNSIMEELAAIGESLRSTKSGQIVSTKLNVPLYARSKKDWLELQGKEGKTRSLFTGIAAKTSNEDN